MPKFILRDHPAVQESCCIYGFFHHRRLRNTAAIARELGISSRAVRYWKRKLKCKEFRCEQRGVGNLCSQYLDPMPRQGSG